MSKSSYLDSFFNLQGKVAALTGAGGYLVGEIARGLANAGMRVAALDLDESKANATANSVVSSGGEAFGMKVDVSRKPDFEKALGETISRFGRVDLLLNGAGINAPTPLFDISEREWDDILGVQLKGTLFGCQVFGRHMVDAGGGNIINISSASAGPPLSKAFAYSVAKCGVKNLTQNIARELAPSKVRVNALRPGFFPTEWSKQNFLSPQRTKAILDHTPMRRFGEPHELIGAVLWLASDAASFVTGAEIEVDGGFSAMTI